MAVSMNPGATVFTVIPRLATSCARALLMPIIPVYTYVTKRLVDTHVKGWQNNVMDHHYSKHMFLLRSVDGAAPGAASGEVSQ